MLFTYVVLTTFLYTVFQWMASLARLVVGALPGLVPSRLPSWHRAGEQPSGGGGAAHGDDARPSSGLDRLASDYGDGGDGFAGRPAAAAASAAASHACVGATARSTSASAASVLFLLTASIYLVFAISQL